MIKRISLKIIFFVLVSLVVYFLHTIGLSNLASHSPISLIQVYIFNTVFTVFLCVTAIVLSKTEKYADQIGFLYLGSVVLKVIFFFLLFYKPIFKSDDFTNIEIFNLLIPIILFLIFEVVVISKILNNKPALKNDK